MVSENNFVPTSQISLPLEAVFLPFGNIFLTNSLLWPVATDILFSGNDILSFIFFEAIIVIRGRPTIKKYLISASENHFLQFCLDTGSNGSNFQVQSNRIFRLTLRSG